ncbi:MAG TPA: MFS transporter, partial [Gemmatimonadaceae bacterium]|nr:MFS transporter [Gemmatimonadaceae bacterium]
MSSETRRAAMRFIVAVGVVSLFADMTYEGAHSIMGAFLSDLGADAFQVGLIAGLGEMIAASLRFFSGRFIDRTRAYWPVAILGYALNLLVIPAIAFATTWKAVAILVVIERTGKALRGPARDVLLSQATGEVGHGWGFGIHSAMDQTGAVLGPLMMVLVVARTHQFAPGFLLLGISAALALGSLLLARAFHPVKGEPPKSKGPQPLPSVFWMYVTAAGFLAFGFVDWPLL